MGLGLLAGEARGPLLPKGSIGCQYGFPKALIYLPMQIHVGPHVFVWVEFARGQEGTALMNQYCVWSLKKSTL